MKHQYWGYMASNGAKFYGGIIDMGKPVEGKDACEHLMPEFDKVISVTPTRQPHGLAMLGLMHWMIDEWEEHYDISNEHTIQSSKKIVEVMIDSPII